MKSVVLVEHDVTGPTPGSLALLARAAGLGDAVGLLLGSGARAAAAQASRVGASVLFVSEDAAFAAPLARPRVAAIAHLIEQEACDTALFDASVLASETASALAARIEAGLNWGLVDLRRDGDRLVGVQAVAADAVRVDCGWSSPLAVGVCRVSGLPLSEGVGDTPVVNLDVAPDLDTPRIDYLGTETDDDRGVPLDGADVVVAAGRGLRSADDLRLIEELAASLGAAVGVTRPLVDAGWYPHANQVGQSGKTVNPKVYVACGISGAVQHRVGMDRSELVIAINDDPLAPIFGYCDVAVVGDLFAIVPRLTGLLNARV